MRDVLGPGTRLGYCTNVHAGPDLAATLENLERHAVAVRGKLGGTDELGIGLWLSADAARAARRDTARLRDRLRELGLGVFTLNGFPYGNFHDAVVKHQVYEPDWGDARRLEYTLELIEILHALLDDSAEGSISTLPIGWPSPPCGPINLDAAAAQLCAVARRLNVLERETGRLIHLDLEPEPGCILQRSEDAVRFWREWLLKRHPSDEAAIRRHLRICHDVCHAAVVFEEQAAAFAQYESAGLRVGKVQISSALCVDFAGLDKTQRCAAMAELRHFDEPRYLHQTGVRTQTLRQFDDLPKAIAATNPRPPDGEWRVHFHVPIHLRELGLLRTTQGDIPPALALARAHDVRHIEVETYAWTVLPRALQPPSLASGIADELRWVAAVAGARP